MAEPSNTSGKFHRQYNGIINTLKGIYNALVPSGGGGLATELKQDAIVTALADLPNIELNTDAINLNVDDLERSNVEIERNTLRSNYFKLENESNDLVTTLTYADAQTDDERITVIGLSGTIDVAGTPTVVAATKTMTYNGSSPYYVTTITLS